MVPELAHSHGRSSGGRLGPWFGQVRAFAGRYGRELFRNKAVLFWSLAFPVAFYLLTITVFVDTSSIPAEVLPYVKAGTAVSYGMFGAIIASLNSFGQQLAADFEADRYVQYRSLPLAPSADLVGRMTAGVVLSVVAFAAVVAVAALTGATFGLRSAVSLPLAALAIVSFAVVWMTVAVLVATLVKDTRYASIITISIALGSYFLTGYNGTDPAAFQGPDAVLQWLPNTAATRLVSHHVAPFPESLAESAAVLSVPGPLAGFAQMAVYGVLALAAAVLLMRTVVYGGVGA
jgi:ABC-2 type transport system permease protein